MTYRLTLASLFAMLLALTTPALAAKAPKVLAGSIVKVSETYITVQSDVGDSTVLPDADTVVVIDGEKKTWADLKVGQQVMVSLRNASIVAQKIQVGAAPDDTPKKKKKKKA